MRPPLDGGTPARTVNGTVGLFLALRAPAWAAPAWAAPAWAAPAWAAPAWAAPATR
ncbi:hypothetical protein [Actinomadura fibrosa]|uniref:hypothetical protein n=1 Tax=Actinomadura fibrosa TaxID=111802 RepID=UPI0013F14A06|nr:hypothetical protein [Actinomadura fibrosa]